MNAKAVKAPPEVSWSEDLQPVDPEEVEEILKEIGSAIVEVKQSKGGAISVTTPMTERAVRRGSNGSS